MALAAVTIRTYPMQHITSYTSKLRSFIRELQRSDDQRKHRWLVGTSAVSMVIVVGLWVIFLNVSVPTVSSGVATASGTVHSVPGDETTSPQDSFGAVLGRGFSIVTDTLGRTLGTAGQAVWQSVALLFSRVAAPHEFTLTPPEHPYLPPQPDPVPTTRLP